MDRISLFKMSGLPDAFGALLLAFVFILLLSPYLSGEDFGMFKIPLFTNSTKRFLKVIGPILFILCVLFFFPLYPIDKGPNTVVESQPTITPTTLTSPTVLMPNSSPSTSPTITPTLSPNEQPTPTPVISSEGAQEYAKRGYQTLKEKRWEESAAAFFKAAELAPKTPEWDERRSQYYYNAGFAAYSFGKWKSAEEGFKQAAKLFPQDPQIHVSLGGALHKQQKWKEAELAFSEALRLASSWPLWGGSTKEECEEKLRQVRQKVKAEYN